MKNELDFWLPKISDYLVIHKVITSLYVVLFALRLQP